ncbi:YbaN family protein [Neobacillus novalis]|uniref:YbaN family protein n=1 Tax=Neobacillus novalis TaxID=220687 RepID=A0AA95MS20_9BACI|nr:YbaN family protein [Neobacillus novalis]WHY88951.1 YbaN family protein [Neobacillus novalis]
MTGGFIALGLGILGIILPLLPTTPFLLLASFCFVKGSDRFAHWFKATKIYQRHLESFVKERAMTLKQKLTILLTADAMIAIPFILLNNLMVRVILLLVICYKYYYFFTKIKTKVSAPVKKSHSA